MRSRHLAAFNKDRDNASTSCALRFGFGIPRSLVAIEHHD
jgi:hypothetical protein